MSRGFGGVVINSRNQVCLIQDSDKGWYLPKGRRKKGENPLETARREIYEETGIKDLTFIKKLGVVKRPSTVNPNQLKVITLFLFKSDQKTLNPPEKGIKAKWFSFDVASKRLYTREERLFLSKKKDEIFQENGIKLVIFDLWNTLAYDKSHEIHEKIAELLGFQSRFDFWDYMDANFMHKKQTFFETIKEIIRIKKLPESNLNQIKELWHGSRNYVETKSEVLRKLKELKKKYKLAVLSNSSSEEAIKSLENLGLLHFFDFVLISSEVGFSKPDPRFFELALNKAKVKPENAVMVGDNLENDIIPARLLGMRAYLLDSRAKYPQYKDEDWYITSLNQLKL